MSRTMTMSLAAALGKRNLQILRTILSCLFHGRECMTKRNPLLLAHAVVTIILFIFFLDCKLRDPSHSIAEQECGWHEAVARAFAARDAKTITRIAEDVGSHGGLVLILAQHCLELLDRESNYKAMEEQGMAHEGAASAAGDGVALIKSKVKPLPPKLHPEHVHEDEHEGSADQPAFCSANDDLEDELEQFRDRAAPPDLQVRLAEHFDVQQFTPQFFFHAMRMRNRINCAWKSDGTWFPWRGYDAIDISNCDEETPECLLWVHPRVNTTMHSADHVRRKCCVEHARLKRILVWAQDLISRYNISAWLAMGSLMAQVRHNGVLIPWDTDIDFYVDGEDEERLLKAFPNLPPRKHWFGRDPRGRAVYWIYYHNIPKVSDAHIELWMWRKGQTKDPSALNPSVYPLRPCKMYNLTMLCPKDSPALLREWYGKDWSTYQFTRGASTQMLTDAVADPERYQMVVDYQRKMAKAEFIKKHSHGGHGSHGRSKH
eukprot:NODE_182_length_2842_cov_29.897243_g165_i0.p1 GENE.NODE_182_length_2842_cov_29.897243_g165_i0~~NODE_182_length_2842_cov_29.897243_g165_i0.p1  ORF type:complete len:488 (+),score=79.59 NODE_182_length_2842_cov_29.897243_g165_i0:1171-2634(+)